jgi:hypothetical protein
MKRNFLVFLVVALITAGGGYWFWTTTPQYAVQQASQAIKQHDVSEFHSWVDVHALSSAAVDDLMSEPVRAVGGGGILERVIGFGLVTLFKPTVVQSMENQIDQAVAKTGLESNPSSSGGASATGGGDGATGGDGSAGAEQSNGRSGKGILGTLVEMVKPPSLTETLRDFGFTKKNYRGVGEVQTKENTSLVGLRFYSPKIQREVTVQLELQKGANRWQITRIANLPDIVRAIVGT